MRKVPLILAFAATILLMLSSCGDEMSGTVTYTANVPVYMPFSEFRSAKSAQPVRKMVNPGKICLYGDYLFINEVGKGIHVVDNSNPAAPKQMSFIELLGNVDVTLKDDILYADSYIDLVWFDLSNPAQPVEIGRSEDVFPNVLPPTNNNYPMQGLDFTKGVVIEWEVKEIKEKVDYQPYYPCPNCYYNLSEAADYGWKKAGTWTSSETASGTNFTSVTGSMSRFALSGDYLYVVNNNSLKVFSLLEGAAAKVYEQYIGWAVETIFPYGDKLFFGTTNGMVIYDITNPTFPTYLSSVAHVLGCDPVVVQGDYAFVTIRGGNVCGQNQSLLEVIDISDPSNPAIKGSFTMQEPYGLGIDGNTLFVCDGGLNVYDATNPVQAGTRRIKQFSDIHGYDVIPYNSTLILIGNDGLYQYDYSDVQNIRELSALKIENE
ncbi:MAG: hypothetical protein LBE56_01805 [Tannerella sp.]|jgi:hypothetical protein|nr:hypothetical protein [Tannerella sp.]